MQNIQEAHCQQCGNTDYEDVGAGSYSGCCNERIIQHFPGQTCTTDECSH